MSQKHFEAAADQIRSYVDQGLLVEANTIYHFCVELFTQFNPRFDAARFRAACGV